MHPYDPFHVSKDRETPYAIEKKETQSKTTHFSQCLPQLPGPLNILKP